MDWLKHILTESDNATACPVRVGSGVVGLIYHAAAGAGVYLGSMHIDIVTLGQYMRHMIELVGVAAAGIGVKSAMKGDAQ